MANYIQHSPKALSHYRQQMMLSRELLAKKARIPLFKIEDGEQESGIFTFKQIQKLAQILMVSDFSLLSDTIKDIDVPDQIDYRNHLESNQEELYLLQKAIRDVANSREDLIYTYDSLEIEPEPFSLELSGNDAVGDAQKIRQFLNINEYNFKLNNNDDYYKAWRNLIESKDIIVLEIARTNIHSEGMALYYPTLPIITILSYGQSASRKLFTMVHELVHLGLRQSAVDGQILKSDAAIERYCNLVAGNVLVPEKSLDALYKHHLSLSENIDNIRKQLKVSKQAIAIQLLLTNRIDKHHFDCYIQDQKSDGFGKTGKQYTAYNRFGKNFVQQVLSAVWGNDVSINTALKILKIDNVEQLNYLEEKAFS